MSHQDQPKSPSSPKGSSQSLAQLQAECARKIAKLAEASILECFYVRHMVKGKPVHSTPPTIEDGEIAWHIETAAKAVAQPHVEREAADLELMRRMLKEVELMRPDTDLHSKGMCRTCDLIREARARLEESKP